MSYEPKENEDYHVVQTLHAGSNSAWSIADEEGNTPGFCFDSREAAQNYLDDSLENGEDPHGFRI